MKKLAPLFLGSLAAIGASTGFSGCTSKKPDVVVYVALDQVFSEALIRRFEEETGLVVKAKYDAEAFKTVGLVTSLREEKANPRCDVFWNNEIANTVALADEGLLAPYDSPSAASIPAEFRDPEYLWTGFAARARIFIVNTDLVPDPSVLTSMWDLIAPEWEGRAVIAKPLTGTTLTHIAALPSVLGEEEAERYIAAIDKGNEDSTVNIATSNGQTMRLVREGKMAFGWTDTDDYNVARAEEFPVAAVFPDQDGDAPLGTMVIPNTVALIAGGPNPENGKRLIDFILSEEVEAELARSRSAQIPVRASVPRPDHVADLSKLHVMQVDFERVGAELPARHEALKERFLD